MMRIILKIGFLLLMPVLADAQQQLPDSIRQAILNASNDSMRYDANIKAHGFFAESNRDSALHYANNILLIVRKNNKKLLEAQALGTIGYQLIFMGHYAEALQSFLQAIHLAQQPENASNDWLNASSDWLINVRRTPEKTRLLILSYLHNMMGILMWHTGNTSKQLFHMKESEIFARQSNEPVRVMFADMNLGRIYVELNKLDSSLIFLNEGRDLALQLGERKFLSGIISSFGDVSLKKGKRAEAVELYNEALKIALVQRSLSIISRIYFRLTNVYLSENQKDSSLLYATKTMEALKALGASASPDINIGIAYENLYKCYKSANQFDSAFKYAGLALATKDSINKARLKSLNEFQSLTSREALRLQKLEKDKELYVSRTRMNALFASLAVFLLIALILYRNNRQKQKAYVRLQQQQKELKATQTQLIQREKMASLGELTAGIAHEIQNPLNFINNFSEVNVELISDLKQEARNGSTAEVLLIADDLEQNLEKINHHGKRADAIVKSMLEHSRTSKGEMQSTDINALVDEYLRLSYRGLRTKNNSFNVIIETHYDSATAKADIIPQDIGSVLLNLFNNAFYAVCEKKKLAGEGFEPTVQVSTQKVDGKIEIKVKDNGTGIPEKVLEKIYQPFFTTKPTGEGTGLGLSLSYDIITKVHGGEMRVETTEGEGAEFIIQLPVKENL